jgi:hypothetical protein
MNLDTITDLDKLKSLAYDQIAAKEQATNNLAAVNQRISELLNQADKVPGGSTPKQTQDEMLGINDTLPGSDEEE